MIAAWCLALGLCLATIMIHYEAIAIVSASLARGARWRAATARRRVTWFVLILFLAHTIEVHLFALGFLVGVEFLALGVVVGVEQAGFQDYAYFSAASYTSVGYGDVYVTGPLRIVAGMEALVGLLMIAWSGAVTVSHMQKSFVKDGGE